MKIVLSLIFGFVIMLAVRKICFENSLSQTDILFLAQISALSASLIFVATLKPHSN